MNRRTWFSQVVAVSFVCSALSAADDRAFELSVYTPVAGKQAEALALVREHGVKFMKKHGIELLGAWTPVDDKDERLIKIVANKDRATAEKNWAAFEADEERTAAFAAATKGVSPIKGFARFLLNATDYSPELKVAEVGDRVFELRTYIASPGNLGGLNDRFRNHTMKLFEKHGMTNIAYFNLSADSTSTVGDVMSALTNSGGPELDAKVDMPAKDNALIYFLTHKSADAMKASFKKFGEDPMWKEVYTESEKKANGPLTAKGGVNSLLLKPTDFSPTK
jgi:hypothetical protein